MIQFVPLILFVVLTNFLSQILLKKGMTDIGEFDLDGSALWNIAGTVVTNWQLLQVLSLWW